MNKDNNKKGHLPIYGIGPILCFPMAVLTAVGIFLSEKEYIVGKISNNTINTILLVIGIHQIFSLGK
ncbi:MAG: hypothetical protein K2N72_04500 [Oscillospiraceae bacterium]|nr:hypothetical protein [Oscillospiraceae bacterium]